MTNETNASVEKGLKNEFFVAGILWKRSRENGGFWTWGDCQDYAKWVVTGKLKTEKKNHD